MAERRFRAMGSDAHVIVVGGARRLMDDAQARIEQLEQRWSRFIDGSEVTRLNQGAGEFVAVSADTVLLVNRAVAGWRLSGGAFDPTLLGAIVRSGYDQSFDQIRIDAPAPQSLLGAGTGEIALSAGAVWLPIDTGFDPGGIGKGLAADLVSEELLADGAEGVSVNLGGDVRVCGVGPTSDGVWTVAVEHPFSSAPIALAGLRDGAVATSTTLRRAWRTDGHARHHLIDPQTGLPSDSDVTLATVIAGDAWIAEVLAKAVLLAGFAHPFDIIGGTGAEALAVADTGAISASSGFAAFLGGVPLPGRLPG